MANNQNSTTCNDECDREDMVILTDLPIFLCRSNYDPIKFKFATPRKTISFGHPIKFNT